MVFLSLNVQVSKQQIKINGETKRYGENFIKQDGSNTVTKLKRSQYTQPNDLDEENVRVRTAREKGDVKILVIDTAREKQRDEEG